MQYRTHNIGMFIPVSIKYVTCMICNSISPIYKPEYLYFLNGISPSGILLTIFGHCLVSVSIGVFLNCTRSQKLTVGVLVYKEHRENRLDGGNSLPNYTSPIQRGRAASTEN